MIYYRTAQQRRLKMWGEKWKENTGGVFTTTAGSQSIYRTALHKIAVTYRFTFSRNSFRKWAKLAVLDYTSYCLIPARDCCRKSFRNTVHFFLAQNVRILSSFYSIALIFMLQTVAFHIMAGMPHKWTPLSFDVFDLKARCVRLRSI